MEKKSLEQLRKEAIEDGMAIEDVDEIIDSMLSSKEINKEIEEEKDKEKIDEERILLGEIYEEIIDTLKQYCDLPDKYIKLIAIWTIGAVHIQNFTTYPYLFINAMRGAGKTRLLKLIMVLCGGDVLNSPTEAVLFRTNTPLGIDEFEGIGRKGNENIRELLNSAYKKGIKVKRMKKIKGSGGEEQVVEEFDVFRAITMANIWGMEDVLGDRCIQIVIDKSSNPSITKKIENFDELFGIRCSLCSVVLCFKEHPTLISAWNNYISNKHNTTLTTLHTLTTLTTQTTLEEKYLNFFNKIDESGLEGRMLELAFPLFFIAHILNEDIFDDLLNIMKEIDKQRKEEDIIENYDISLIEFISQEPEENFYISIRELSEKFKQFLQSSEEWINSRWMGRALKRLNLIKEKRRLSQGIEIIPDIQKAQEKIKIFK